MPPSTDNAGRALAYLGNGLRVPKDGWNAREFARQARLLVKTLHRAATLTQLRLRPKIARAIRENMAHKRDMILRICLGYVPSRLGGEPAPERKASISIRVSFWEQAINDFLTTQDPALVSAIRPHIQSAMAQAVSRTGRLLAMPHLGADHATNLHVLSATESAAQRVTQINETTRTQIQRTLHRAVEENLTEDEAGRLIQEQMDGATRYRGMLIARTELNRAWNRGTTLAMKQDEGLVQVSVVGCMSREQDRWDEPSFEDYLFDADGREPEGTCNIRNVPIEFVDELEFHPNHVGSIVPAFYRE